MNELKIDETIPGWTSRTQLEVLAHMSHVASTKDDPQILEIGTWAGRSLFALASNCPKGRVIALDPGKGYTLTELKERHPNTVKTLRGDPDEWQMWHTNIKYVRLSVIAQHKLKNVDMRDTRSENFFPYNYDKFDLIYIDGDHETNSVRRDLENAKVALKNDGVICGDDYTYWKTVALAVDQFVEYHGWAFHHNPHGNFFALAETSEILAKWLPQRNVA